MARSKTRDIVVATAVALPAVLVLPPLALLLRSVGPAGRIHVWPYLISAEGALVGLIAALVGACAGLETLRYPAMGSDASGTRERFRPSRLTLACVAALCLGVLAPQLSAFPAQGSATDRQAWATAHVPEYAHLVSLLERLPELQRDVGQLITVAPTADENQGAAQEMNGHDLRFTLDVVGNTGRGVMRVDCTLEDQHVLRWDSSSWTFAGRTIPIHVPVVRR